MSDKLLIDRKLLERLQERLDPHIDARDWGMICDTFRATHPTPASVGGMEMVRPLGYLNKKDVARLQDEITWDGTYLTVGVDHWAQWQEDTPYDHLQAIYTHPATVPATSRVVQVEVLRDLLDEGPRAATWAAQDKLRAMLEVKP